MNAEQQAREFVRDFPDEVAEAYITLRRQTASLEGERDRAHEALRKLESLVGGQSGLDAWEAVLMASGVIADYRRNEASASSSSPKEQT